MKSDSVVVCESLLMELDAQMAEAEAEKRETDELIRRRNNPGMADYRWLVSTPPKSYEMPQLERLELESMCMKVRKQSYCWEACCKLTQCTCKLDRTELSQGGFLSPLNFILFL